MTIGIYLLNYKEYSAVYVGQSVNIEKRYKEHLYALHAGRENYKMQNAYNIYGIPLLEIITECSLFNLDIEEAQYIREFDSVNNGLNIAAGSVGVLYGDLHYNSAYSNEQIIKVLDLLIQEPLLPLKSIAKVTKVSLGRVQAISSLTTHCWLKELYPEKYSKLESLKQGDRKLSSKSISNLNKNYPPIQSPTGEVYTVSSAKKFADNFGLNPSHIIGVLSGKRNSHKGWIAFKGDISSTPAQSF